MFAIYWLRCKWLNEVGWYYIKIVITVVSTDVKENNFPVPCRCSKCSPEMTDGLQPVTKVHIKIRSFMDHPLNRKTITQIFFEGYLLVVWQVRHESLYILPLEDDEKSPENFTIPSLTTPYPWDIVHLVDAKNTFPHPIDFKTNFIAISNLKWSELDIMDIRSYFSSNFQVWT